MFTPDGRSIVFVTERFSTDLETLEPGPLRLARLDLATQRRCTPIPAFLRGKHLSPQVSADGRTVTFIADPDGVSNLYRMPIDGGPIVQLSSFVDRRRRHHDVESGAQRRRRDRPPGVQRVRGRRPLDLRAGRGEDRRARRRRRRPVRRRCCPAGRRRRGDVQRLLTDTGRGLPAARQRARRDAVQAEADARRDRPADVSAPASAQFGGYVGGSISALFSDMLGDRLLGMGAQVGGIVRRTSAAQLIVRQSPASLELGERRSSQLPYPRRLSHARSAIRPRKRIIADARSSSGRPAAALFGIAAFPFSAATRVEFSGGARDADVHARDARSRPTTADTQRSASIARRRTRQIGEPLYLGEGERRARARHVVLRRDQTDLRRRDRASRSDRASARSLHDACSPTGAATSCRSARSRSARACDALRPLRPRRRASAARRSLRRLSRVRARLRLRIVRRDRVPEQAAIGPECAIFDNLIGSRMLVTNIEVRAPLAGLFRGELEYGRLPVDVAAFFDAGVAWSSATTSGVRRRHARTSSAASAARVRVNVFGLLHHRTRRVAPVRSRRSATAVADRDPAGILTTVN